MALSRTALAIVTLAVGLSAAAAADFRCPVGYSPVGGSCYMVTAAGTIQAGAETCGDTDGRVASLDSQQELDDLAGVLNTKVWVATNNVEEEGVSVNDGPTTNSPEIESLDCTVMSDTQEVVGCDGEYSALCEAEPETDEREFTCPEGFTQFSNKCYLLSEGTGTFDEGVAFCGNSSYPAFISSQEEQDFIAETFNETLYISANDRANEDSFVDDMFGSVLYTNWGSWEPNNLFGEDCVVLREDTGMLWNDKDCTTEVKILCEVPGTPVPRYVCQESEMKFDDATCYYAAPADTKGTYDEAVAYCNELSMTVAGVHSQEQQDFVQNMVTDSTWLGFTDKDAEGFFTWSDGGDAEYENFQSGEPNNFMWREDCVELVPGKDFQWNDKNCRSDRSFLCQGFTTME